MSEAELEIKRLELEVELEKAKAETAKQMAEVSKPKFYFRGLIVTSVAGPLVVLFGQWWNARYQAQEAEKIEKTTIAAAADVKGELTAANVKTDASIAAIAGKQEVVVAGVDAGNKSWLAWQTKDPGDMDAAARAVVNAERLTEHMPAVIPK